jgi:quinolinate synthase
MANMITADQLRKRKKELPEATVVCYVNSTAEVKSESDICCTSANAVRVINSLAEAQEILFIPDKYLGHYVSTKTDKKIILWNGFCPTHVRILPEDIVKLKEEHPEAKVVVHPECTPQVIELADRVASTSGILKYARDCDAEDIIVGTEVGIIHRLQKENPDKKFYPASPRAICPNMKLINLEKVLWALEDMAPRIEVPPDVAWGARRAIDKMLAVR